MSTLVLKRFASVATTGHLYVYISGAHSWYIYDMPCMYVCMLYVCMYVCMCVCVCMYACVYVCVYVCVTLYVSVCFLCQYSCLHARFRKQKSIKLQTSDLNITTIFPFGTEYRVARRIQYTAPQMAPHFTAVTIVW